MIYKTYGSTGLKVSAVGFGGMRFDTERSNEENAELLHYAFGKGITCFDTAPDYCKDCSEDIFGIALRQLARRRSEFYVSTKGLPGDYDTADKARTQVQKSLQRLGTDYLDFYYVWCIRAWPEYELAMRPGGQYEGLLRCKEEGLIRHIAVSTHLRGDDVERLLSKREFEGVLLGVNILNYLYRRQGVEAADRLGLGVVAMNPLAGGVIPQNEKTLGFLASEGRTPTEAALSFCLSCPQITVTLNGFTTREHIDMACRVADEARPFSAEDVERIHRRITRSMDTLCTGCQYCMDKCPREIPIASFMQFYNQKLLAGKTDAEMAKRLDEEKNWGILVDRKAEAEDCVRCGRCELACTQHLDIIHRLEAIAGYSKLS